MIVGVVVKISTSMCLHKSGIGISDGGLRHSDRYHGRESAHSIELPDAADELFIVPRTNIFEGFGWCWLWLVKARGERKTTRITVSASWV
jgi:hypothetical protein